MKEHTPTANRPSNGATSVTASRAAPVEVFYVVQSTGTHGTERGNCLRSALYETRPQAETERVRLQQADSGGQYGVWKSATYIEPAEWLHRVVRSDGTLILPRLNGVEKSADA